MSSDEESVGSNEVSEVMSPQVSLETMGPVTVTDLPRSIPWLKTLGDWLTVGWLQAN